MPHEQPVPNISYSLWPYDDATNCFPAELLQSRRYTSGLYHHKRDYDRKIPLWRRKL